MLDGLTALLGGGLGGLLRLAPEILKWVDRPEILGTAKPAPKKAMADDEVPF